MVCSVCVCLMNRIVFGVVLALVLGVAAVSGVVAADTACDPDNPLFKEDCEPVDESTAIEILDEWRDDPEHVYDGEEITDAEMIGYLLEWREHTDEEDVDVGFEVVNLEVSDDVVEGDVVELEATFENQGAPGSGEVELYVEDGDGSRVVSKTRELSLNQDEEGHVEVEWMTEFLDSGGYTAYASSDDDVVSMDFTVTPVEPELLGVSHSPDVAALETPEDRANVTVEAEFRYATTIDVMWEHDDVSGNEIDSDHEFIVNGDEVGEDSVWQVEIEIPNPGEFPAITEYEFNAINEDPDTGVMNESAFEGDEYRTFKHVEDVAVVYAKFSDSVPGFYWPNKQGSDLAERQDARQEVINQYMISWKGTWGGVGYDFKFYDNDGDWFTLDRPTSDFERPGDNPREIFATHSIKQAHQFADFSQDKYSSTITVSPSHSWDIDSRSGPGERHSTDANVMDTARAWPKLDDEMIYLNEEWHGTPIWIHELGHSPMKFWDLYPEALFERREVSGDLGGTGMMGHGAAVEPLMPFSIVTRTELHPLIEDGHGAHPWLGTGEISEFREITVGSLESMEYDDEAKVFVSTGDEDLKIPLEARGQEMVVEDVHTDFEDDVGHLDLLERGVYLYEVDESYGLFTERTRVELREHDTADRPDGPTLSEVGDSWRTRTSWTAFADFELVDARGFADTYTAEVEVEEEGFLNPGVKTSASFTDVEPPRMSEDGESTTLGSGVTFPNIRLRATTANGEEVGYRDGEYSREISGVSELDASGDSLFEEWIIAPENQSVMYVLDSTDVERYLEELTDRPGLDGGDLETNETEARFTFNWYDESAAYNQTTGEIDDAVTQQRNVTLAPNETTAVGVNVHPEFNPETLNKQGEGKWVNVTFQIPHDEVDVGDVNLSTVQLNEGVDAETDEQYGFVRNPVEDDTFKAKFPRDEVSEVLETGENVTVTITGETEENVLIVGADVTRVIDRAPEEVPDLDCPPGEAVGPHEGAEGVAHGPPECPPGHSDEHPGRGVGQDGTTPGYGGDNPGRSVGSDDTPPGHGGGGPGDNRGGSSGSGGSGGGGPP